MLATGRFAATLLTAALAVPACVDEPIGEELDVTCDGKCDGIGTLRSIVRNPSDLDLGDLVAVGSQFAAQGLSSALSSTDYASIRIDEPRFFALPGTAAGDLTLENVDELVSGLAARFGERELTTEVNALRQAHLNQSSDKVFVESAFRIGANLNPSWGSDVGGLGQGDARASVGFGAGAAIEARVINAYGGELAGAWRAPLAAVQATRGFVLPASAADIRAMKPGESFALSGEGHLGANLGVGVPILAANPVGPITYTIVLSAGLRTRISGQLDVQLVRLDGDEVVVDVGMQKARSWSAYLALDDAWGVQGLLETNLSLGGINLDLGRLVDKALQKQLNSKLSLFSAEASRGTSSSRISVARLRFALDGGEAGVIEPALAQALRGDVRLAQALAARGEPGVKAEFDLLRSGSSTASSAGIDLLGMSFFKRKIASEGSVVIQTPGGVQTLMFQSLRKESGSWFSEHGYTRVGLSGLNFDPADPADVRGEANLFVQLQEADEYMERDKLLDHVDAAIVAIGGQAALARIEREGNALERYVRAACPNSEAFDPCRREVLTQPEVARLRAAGRSAAQSVAAGLSPDLADLLVSAATLRMTAQATYEGFAAHVGPETTLTVDYRLDDAALAELMTTPDATAVKQALRTYVGATGVDRRRTDAQLATDRTALANEHGGKIDRLAKHLVDAQGAYQRLIGIERAVIERLGPVGPRALEISVPVDAQNRPKYEEATARSLAEARQQRVTKMFDAMVKDADGFPTHAEQVVGYLLLSLISPERTDYRIDGNFDNLDDSLYRHYREAGYADFDLYGKGSQVAPIDGGLFTIDALLAGN